MNTHDALEIHRLHEIRLAAEALFDDYQPFFATGGEPEQKSRWRNLGRALFGDGDPRVHTLQPQPVFRVGELLQDCFHDRDFAFVVQVDTDGTHVIDYRQGFFSAYKRTISDPRNYRVVTADVVDAIRTARSDS